MLQNYLKVKKQHLLLTLLVFLVVSLLGNTRALVRQSNSDSTIGESVKERVNLVDQFIFHYDQPSYLKSNIPQLSYSEILNFHLYSLLVIAVIHDRLDLEKSKSKRPSVISNGRLIETQQLDKEQLNTKIKGKTLEIYYYMHKLNSEVGIREVAREFGYSSPALAAYHLNRLVEYDLAVKTNTNKFVPSETEFKIGDLSSHVKIAGIWISQFSLFMIILSLFTIIGCAYFLLHMNHRIWAVTFIPLYLFSMFMMVKINRST